MTTEQALSPLSPEQKRWRINVLAATWSSYVGYYFCRKAFGVLKPALREQYHFQDIELAQIWTAFLVAYMLGQFLSAWLGRKTTCRLLLLTGMGVSLIANLAFGFATLGGTSAYWWMITFMTVNGFAQATGWPGNVGLLAKWARHEERGRLMALWGTCYQLGSIAAKHFAAFMLAWLGIAWSFWGASIILFAIWVLFYFWGQEQPEDVGLPSIVEEITLTDEEAAEEAKKDGGALADSSTRPWEEAIKVVIAMGMIYFCFKFLRYALDSWSSTLLKDAFMSGPNAISSATAGHLSVAFDWVGFLGVIVGGFLSDKIFKSQRTPVIFFMTVGMFISTLFLWWFGTSSLWVFVALLGFIGFMLMGPDSLISGTAAMDVCSKEMAVVASGIINGLGSIGPIVQELVIGYLKTSHGPQAVFTLLLGVSILAVFGTGLLWWRIGG